ncbi:MAG TPA: hypothetical protein VGN55_25945 [Xanthobacteraceae bacterium]
MADETPPPPGAPGQPERRRPAPTIDLKATEVASEPVAGAEPSGSGPPGPPPDQDAAASMPPKSAAPRSAALAAMSWPLVGAGLAAVILTLGIAWMVAFGTGGDSSATEARVAQLERQVVDLAGRTPANATGDLASRLQKLEAQVTQQAKVVAAPSPDPALTNRVASLEAQLKSQNETLSALRQRNDSAAAANAAALNDINQRLARQDPPAGQSGETAQAAAANAATIAALANRLDALEADAKTTETALAAEVAKRDAESSDDHAVRIAVTAAALTAAVERGRPFAAELKAAQSQGPDPSALAPLEAFASTGVPNANALVRELTSLEPALLQAAGVRSSEGGLLEKLQANAERLVRIRPIEEVPGDDPAAVIARIEVKAVHGDLPGALTELGNLPANVRAPAQPWIARAQARAAALAASRAFAADALAALARPSR